MAQLAGCVSCLIWSLPYRLLVLGTSLALHAPSMVCETCCLSNGHATLSALTVMMRLVREQAGALR